ncbi:MAG: DUF1328 domain-containing protein [Opitutaceae bacterium]
MLRWALVFLAAAIITAVFGYTEIATAVAGLVRTLFYIFAGLFIVTLLLHLLRSSSVD